jgi:exosome complex component RRP41
MNRVDNREKNQLRNISFEVRNDIAECRFGNNRALARVLLIQKPSPKNLDYEREACTVDCRYVMRPWSCNQRFTARSYSNRRCIEISEVIKRVFYNIIIVEEYAKKQVYLIADMIQTDGGSRITAINALSLSLAKSSISHRALPVGISFGKNADSQMVLDLDGSEDETGLADVPVVFEQPTGKISLLQMEGDLSLQEFTSGLRLAEEKSMQIYSMILDKL